MGQVTAGFQNESPLHPAAQEFLADAFSRGWADPVKIHAQSRQVAILLNEAKETFSAALGLPRAELYFLGEAEIGFNLGICGLMAKSAILHYSPIDRREVFAIVESDIESAGFDLNSSGQGQPPKGEARDVLCWQSANGETGVRAKSPTEFRGAVFADNTSSGTHLKLPDNWATALWDSKSWQGPAGLAVFGLRSGVNWRNPLPNIDSRIVPGSFAVPLAIASAIAVDSFNADYTIQKKKVEEFNRRIRRYVKEEIGDVEIAGEIQDSLPHLMSFAFRGVDAEHLVSELERRGFSIDSGSACSSVNLRPSHVLAAMGLSTLGNVRLTLRPTTTVEEVAGLLRNLEFVVKDLRA